jgi:Xaa-Pro dipeptidase
MEENEVDALLITGEENYTYFSGHQTLAPNDTYSRPMLLLLPRERDPVIISPSIYANPISRISWIKDVRKHNQMGTAPIELVGSVLKDLGLDAARIGMELGHDLRLGMPVGDFLRMRENVAEVEFVDGTDILWKLRMLKSPEEIECLEQSCQITSSAYEMFFGDTRESMSELEAASLIKTHMMQKGAEIPRIFAFVSGPDMMSPRDATNRILIEGDFVWFDGGCTCKGYWSDFSRGGVIGSATETQRKTYELIHQMTMRCVDMVKPGIRPEEIVSFCDNEFRKAGLRLETSVGRIGHGVGLKVSEPPSIANYDKTTIEAGMVLALEPGIETKEGIFIVEENIAVGADKCRLLTTASRELHEI